MRQAADRSREWATRIQEGDPTAESELITYYERPIRLLLIKRTGSIHLASDLSQDTFIVVLRRLRAGELKNPAALSAFIRQTAINISIDHFRKEKRYIRQDDEIISLHTTHRDNKADELDSGKTRELLESALEKLTMSRDRELLRRFYLDDEDKERICKDMELSATHFDRVLYRAKQRMKELISQQKGLKSLLLGYLFDG